MTTEVEARFGAPGPEPLRRLAARTTLGSGALGPPRGFLEDDVYLDSATGALSAARWACRLRTRDGRTVVSLKGPPESEAGGWLHRRPEVEGPATPDRDPAAWPPSAAKERLIGLAGGAALQERFVLRQHRVERSVTVGAKRVGTLTLDTVDVERDGANRGRFHVVELELATDTEDEGILRPLAAALDAAAGLTPEPRTKLERALEILNDP